MKNIPLLLALILLLDHGNLRAAGPTPSDPRAAQLVAQLGMTVIPGESGFLSLIGASAQKIPVMGHPIAIQSQVYYMLTRELPTNYLHWLAPDDTHVLVEGGPVDYYIFHPDGRVEMVTLGHDFAHGQQLVVPVPGNCWKALRLHPAAGYALMANLLSPEWTPDAVKIGAGADWVARYRGKAPWATESFLRELIGPNFKG